MKVESMTNDKGNSVANQFIIWDDYTNSKFFQSFGTIIVQVKNGKVYLDENCWDCSKTTGKYRNQFLGESKAETQAKIDSGEYILTNLN